MMPRPENDRKMSAKGLKDYDLKDYDLQTQVRVRFGVAKKVGEHGQDEKVGLGTHFR